jgi:hypothetical protein
MAPNPLKPLIKGMFVMLAVAAVVLLAYVARLALIAEQERVAESQKRSKEINEGFRRKMEADQQANKLRREQEAARAKEAAERRAKEAAARSEAEAKKRPVDVGMAFGEVRRRAESGDPNAQYLLGRIYFLGMDHVVRMDPSTYGLSLDTRATSALLSLKDITRSISGLRFINIPLLPADRKEAVRWYERAANQGHREAQSSLMSVFYYEFPDAVAGYKWSLLCDGPPIVPNEFKLVEHTPEWKKMMLERWPKKLTPEQKAVAEQQAKAFVPKKEKP